MYIFLATILTTAAVVLLQQFKFHLPAKYTVIYSVMFLFVFGVLFTYFADTLNLKTISVASLMVSIIAVLLIVVTRRFEAQNSDRR